MVNMSILQFRLKSRYLLSKYGNGRTLYRIAKDGGANYATLHRWLKTTDAVGRFDGSTLIEFLLGLGLNTDQVKSLSIGEVFEWTESQLTE